MSHPTFSLYITLHSFPSHIALHPNRTYPQCNHKARAAHPTSSTAGSLWEVQNSWESGQFTAFSTYSNLRPEIQGRLGGPSPFLSTLPPLQLIAIALEFCSHAWWWECLCPSQWMNLRRREVPHGSVAAWEAAGWKGRFPVLSSSVPYLMFLRSAVRAFTTALKASSLPGATHLSGWSSTASFL